MALRLVARASNSSLRRVTGTRSLRLPDMILDEVCWMVSMRRRTRRAVMPPAMTENRMIPTTPARKLCRMMAE
ncbi:hypothetical protein D3C87_2086470 [compost metagenome]